MDVPRTAAIRVVAATLLVTLTVALAGPASATGTPQRRATVTLAALPASVDAGTTVVVKGTAPKSAAVKVQQRRGTSWTTIATAKASTKGAWSARVRFATGGTSAVRAVVGTAASATRPVDVYQWLDLSRQPFATSIGSASGVTLTVNEQAFPRSLYSYGARQALTMWALDRRCTDVVYGTGLRDSEYATSGRDETLTTQAAAYAPDNTLVAYPPQGTADWNSGAAEVRAGRLGRADRFIVAVNQSGSAEGNVSLPILTPRARCKATGLRGIGFDEVPAF
ncbi:hypothetical protein [Nocardioides sp.]|uniref:hypothetical protein n=1 Tax=Nocardioides sp. TaxID=35761 RepID=UPI003516E1B2